MPADFETLYDESDCEMLRDAYAAVSKCGLWQWLATYSPPIDKGFMFAEHPNLARIDAEMKYEGHSGFSHAWTMRVMEAIAKDGGWENYKKRVLESRNQTRACPCRAELGYQTGWCGVAGGGVPACDH